MRGRALLLSFVTVAFVAGVVGITALEDRPAALPPLEDLDCNDHVDHSVRLADDIGPNCPGTGLTVDRDGIILDLNGHTIDGDDGFDNGITLSGRSRVTVRNGTVTDFLSGIVVSGGSGDLVERLRLGSNTDYGMQVLSERSTARNNQSFSNPTGILITGIGNRVTNNVVQGNIGDGIEFAGTRHVISGNRAISNGGDGILEGISSASVNTLSRNVAASNDLNGIKILGTRTRVSRNRTDHNSALGIDAVPGTIDLGGNTANGNGSAHQCENVVCS